MEKSGRERRRVLKGLAFASAFSLLLWKYLVPSAGAPREELVQVPKESLPTRGALVFRESRVAIVREDEELYALSLVCTHLGCTVTVTPGEIICPCHGSVFDRRGEPLKGPANKPLQRLQIEERGDSLVVLA